MKQQRPIWPYGRIIAFGLAVVCWASGIFCLVQAHVFKSQFRRLQEIHLVDIPIDLSTTGQYAVTFTQTRTSSHGEAICLVIPQDRIVETNALELLRFDMDIKDQNGVEKIRTDWSVEDRSSPMQWMDGAIVLALLNPLEKGTYRLTITVTQGEPFLKTMPQRLLVRPLFCGLEELAAFLFNAAGIAALLIGTLIFFLLRLHRSKRHETGP